MKKVYKVCDLDCANCAMKMEQCIKEIDGVNDASVSFMAQRIVLEMDESKQADIEREMVRRCRRVEPDCKIKI